jgi:hypothetical protein
MSTDPDDFMFGLSELDIRRQNSFGSFFYSNYGQLTLLERKSATNLLVNVSHSERSCSRYQRVCQNPVAPELLAKQTGRSPILTMAFEILEDELRRRKAQGLFGHSTV